MAKILQVTSVQVDTLESNPIQLMITVTGMASTPGWTDIRLDLGEDPDPNDDVLEYTLLGTPPEGIVPQVLTPVVTSTIYSENNAERIVAVMVHARTNSITEWIGFKLPPVKSDFSTLAIGEEGPSTPLFGEEGPTTRLFGEEGPSTPLFGEEGPWPKTFRIGEEDPKTFRFGEEGPTTDPRIDDPIPPIHTHPAGESTPDPRGPHINPPRPDFGSFGNF